MSADGQLRIMRRYRPSCDKRRDPMTRGLCGVVWCERPARWVWFDRAGRQRHRCEEHACSTSHGGVQSK